MVGAIVLSTNAASQEPVDSAQPVVVYLIPIPRLIHYNLSRCVEESKRSASIAVGRDDLHTCWSLSMVGYAHLRVVRIGSTCRRAAGLLSPWVDQYLKPSCVRSCRVGHM